jgi:hypothetical protein
MQLLPYEMQELLRMAGYKKTLCSNKQGKARQARNRAPAEYVMATTRSSSRLSISAEGRFERFFRQFN